MIAVILELEEKNGRVQSYTDFLLDTYEKKTRSIKDPDWVRPSHVKKGKTKKIPDPMWSRPTILVPSKITGTKEDPNWERPTKEVEVEETFTNDDGEEEIRIVTTTELDMDAKPSIINIYSREETIPDKSAKHPMIEEVTEDETIVDHDAEHPMVDEQYNVLIPPVETDTFKILSIDTELPDDFISTHREYKYANGKFVHIGLNEEEDLIAKDHLLLQLREMATKKTIAAKTLLNGEEVTDDQLARYEDKYRIANSDDLSLLAPEAKLIGKTPEELAQLIINLHGQYRGGMDDFNAKIELMRVAAKIYIKTKPLNKGKELLVNLDTIDHETTEKQMLAFFK